MIALIKTLTAGGVVSMLFTLSCIAGAWSALPQHHRVTSAKFTAPIGCEYAASVDGKTVHRLDCPLLPPQSASKANLIYFHTLAEAGERAACPHCLTSNADTASMSAIPTMTPSANEAPATTHH